MKYILVTGGVISGIGKGVISSTIGTLLRCHGLNITSIKIDPYINIDAGTFSPYEHGEVYVLDDGGEVDLDLGNYERFLDITLTSLNNITTGKIYLDVITNERKGNYLGKTVQVIPHITNAIQSWVERVAKIPVDGTNIEPQVCIIELGGTIGDIESMPFVEAFRQFQFRVQKENFCVVHVSLIPQLSSGEQKTKPTQASVRELRGLGLTPDFIVARCVDKLLPNVIEKLANFCHVSSEQVLALPDISNIYKVPIILEEQNFVKLLLNNLNYSLLNAPLNNKYYLKWKSLAERFDKVTDEVTIVLVGKYTQFEDSYTSIVKALQHAAITANHKIKIKMVESIKLEGEHKHSNLDEYNEAWNIVKNSDGILVPGGFGDRGIPGKVLAIKWARENNKPLLGICLGMQLSLIEIARNVLHLANATSAEFLLDNSLNSDKLLGTNVKSSVDICIPLNIDLQQLQPASHTTQNAHDNADVIIQEMPEFNPLNKGGTMRLGKRKTLFKKTQSIHSHKENVKFYNSKVKKLYGDVDFVEERHRHRYEFNTKFKDDFERVGLHFVGEDETGQRMEIIELEDHPFFVGTQFHPEYKTRPLRPSPIYYGFILASIGKLENILNTGEDLLLRAASPMPNQLSTALYNSNQCINTNINHDTGIAFNCLVDDSCLVEPSSQEPSQLADSTTTNSTKREHSPKISSNDFNTYEFTNDNNTSDPPPKIAHFINGDVPSNINTDAIFLQNPKPTSKVLQEHINISNCNIGDILLHPRIILSKERMFSPEKQPGSSNNYSVL